MCERRQEAERSFLIFEAIQAWSYSVRSGTESILDSLFLLPQTEKLGGRAEVLPGGQLQFPSHGAYKTKQTFLNATSFQDGSSLSRVSILLGQKHQESQDHSFNTKAPLFHCRPTGWEAYKHSAHPPPYPLPECQRRPVSRQL